MKLTDGGDKKLGVLDMKRFLLAGSFTLVAVLSTGCGSDKQGSAAESIADDTPAVTVQPSVTSTSVFALPSPTYRTQAATTTPDAVPQYWIRDNGHPRYITVIVPTRYPRDDMFKVMKDVVYMHVGEEGGWHVNIDCGTSADSTGGTRLGTSSFALDNLGLAQTGLKQKFQPATILIDGASCD